MSHATFVPVKVKKERQRGRHISRHWFSECVKYCQLWFSSRCQLIHSQSWPVSCIVHTL